MRDILRMKRSINTWFLLWLILVFMLISPISKVEAASKTKDGKQNICGEHLELVWSKALLPPSSPQIKRGPITMQVLPSGENHMVHTVIWKGGESSDMPRDIITFVLDSNGNKLWRGEYNELPPMAHGGIFSVGKYTYRHFDSGNLRYHVWLDEKAVIQWVYAQRAISPLYKYREEGYQREEVEVGDGVVYHLIANCKNGLCQVDSLSVSEKGVDPKGWQTILRWTYPENNKDKVVYHPVSVSTSHLLVYKKEIEVRERIEYHLIQFLLDGNGKIFAQSKYSFPTLPIDRSITFNHAFKKNKDGSFMFFIAEDKKGVFIRLDKTGEQIETRSYNLPQKFNFSINSIDPLKSGRLTIIGSVEVRKGRDILRPLAMMRLSSNGLPLWFHVYDDNLDLAGMDSENVFFSKQGTLYKCRERQVITGK